MKPRYKPIDRPECEDTWFCYFIPPRGQGQPSALTKPLSQVPDLNQGRKSTSTGAEDCRAQVRGAVNPNDSKYIRLAKAGGRKNLLTFTDNPSKAKEPVPYPVSEWYYDNYPHHDSNIAKKDSKAMKYPQRPEWMTHIEHDPTIQQKTPYRPNRGIIAWDKMSAWKREEFERMMQQKARAIYEKKRREERQERRRKPDFKVNSNGLTEGTRIKLPKIDPKKLQGTRKLSGADLKVHWYEKWYIANRALEPFVCHV